MNAAEKTQSLNKQLETEAGTILSNFTKQLSIISETGIILLSIQNCPVQIQGGQKKLKEIAQITDNGRGKIEVEIFNPANMTPAKAAISKIPNINIDPSTDGGTKKIVIAKPIKTKEQDQLFLKQGKTAFENSLKHLQDVREKLIKDFKSSIKDRESQEQFLKLFEKTFQNCKSKFEKPLEDFNKVFSK